MLIKKVALSRRTVLRGIGTALALPFLDAMMPAFAAAAVRVLGVSEHVTLEAAAALAFASLVWLPLTRRWNARGHLCWASSIFLFVMYFG